MQMQILNQRDYRSAKARLAQLQAALGPEAVIENLTSSLSADITSARRQALAAEAKRLREEIEGYEKLQSISEFSGDIPTDDLGLLPIVGRVARRLSQRELADLLEVSEQQIQRYESDRYSTISLSRYQRLLEALGIDLRSRLKSTWSIANGEHNEPSLFQDVDAALLSELRKQNWISIPKGASNDAVGQILATYVSESAELTRGRTLHRRLVREASAIDNSALLIWQARALRQAMAARQKLKTKFNIVDNEWISKLVRLSSHKDGPRKAADLLRDKGILLIVVPHLPHTRLDGAAMQLADGTPVIAITIRYDRLDSFWFTLAHELGHIFLHFNHGLEAGFMDNLDIGGTSNEERDADLFALSALIPDQVWETAPARFSKSDDLVRRFAESAGINPAIVAGRIRKERGDYRIFNELVGNGLVRPQFSDQ